MVRVLDHLRYLVGKKAADADKDHKMRWAGRLIPSFSMRCRNVFGCKSSAFAAPLTFDHAVSFA